MKTLYLDEVGDHNLGNYDRNFPIFLLCGCVIDSNDLNDFTTNFNQLKQKYWESKNINEIIFVSRKIRKQENPFNILQNQDTRQAFYTDINNLVVSTNFQIISSIIDKPKHLNQYHLNAGNPYKLSLQFILERFFFILKSCNDTGKIIIEARGKKEDKELNEFFIYFINNGNDYFRGSELRQRITSDQLTFFKKKDNVAGLQLADLCAYPIAKNYLINNNILQNLENKPYELIKEKIYHYPKHIGYGLKIFPK